MTSGFTKVFTFLLLFIIYVLIEEVFSGYIFYRGNASRISAACKRIRKNHKRQNQRRFQIYSKIKRSSFKCLQLKFFQTHDDLVPRRTPDFLVPQQHSFSHVTLQAGAQTKQVKLYGHGLITHFQPSTCKLPDNLLAQRVQELLQRAANARQEGISSQLPPQLQQKYFEEALTVNVMLTRHLNLSA